MFIQKKYVKMKIFLKKCKEFFDQKIKQKLK